MTVFGFPTLRHSNSNISTQASEVKMLCFCVIRVTRVCIEFVCDLTAQKIHRYIVLFVKQTDNMELLITRYTSLSGDRLRLSTTVTRRAATMNKRINHNFFDNPIMVSVIFQAQKPNIR